MGDRVRDAQIGLRSALAAIGQAAAHLIWPSMCLCCGRFRPSGWQWLCPACWHQLITCTTGTACPLCGDETSPYALIDQACLKCLGNRPIWDGLCRCGVYQDVLRDLILGFKHGRAEFDRILSDLANSALQGCSWYQQIDLFVPVPLHWLRRLQRGYNQAQIITRRLRHPKAKSCDALARVRWTAPQTSMPSPSARLRNIRGAFAVRKDVKGKVVCIVDDIKTTGATLSQCTMALKEAGAKAVYALVLAVA